MFIGLSPHHSSPQSTQLLKEYLVLVLGEETAAQAEDGSNVWEFRKVKKRSTFPTVRTQMKQKQLLTYYSLL